MDVQFGALRVGAVFYCAEKCWIKVGTNHAQISKPGRVGGMPLNPAVAAIFRKADMVEVDN